MQPCLGESVTSVGKLPAFRGDETERLRQLLGQLSVIGLLLVCGLNRRAESRGKKNETEKNRQGTQQAIGSRFHL